MAYLATVIPVMIASPGDVLEEREVIRETLHSWNDSNSSRENIVLLPVGWETHSSPDLSGRPQEIINQRVLRNCDLLIGVFWTRLGSPTGNFESGTVEEIQEHHKAGKPVMLYFSSKDIAPEKFDAGQYEKLEIFKKWCREQGLIGTFKSLEEFKGKLFRQLDITIYENQHIKNLLAETFNEIEGQHKSLSTEALALLKMASEGDGMIYNILVNEGRIVKTAKKSFSVSDGRKSAEVEHSLKELRNNNLVSPYGEKGNVFQLTHEGWELADTIDQDCVDMTWFDQLKS